MNPNGTTSDLNAQAKGLSPTMREGLLTLAQGTGQPHDRTLYALVSRGLVNPCPQGTTPVVSPQGYRVAAWVVITMRGGHGYDYAAQAPADWLAAGILAVQGGHTWHAYLCAMCIYLHANESNPSDRRSVLAQSARGLEKAIRQGLDTPGPALVWENGLTIDDPRTVRLCNRVTGEVRNGTAVVIRATTHKGRMVWEVVESAMSVYTFDPSVWEVLCAPAPWVAGTPHPDLSEFDGDPDDLCPEDFATWCKKYAPEDDSEDEDDPSECADCEEPFGVDGREDVADGLCGPCADHRERRSMVYVDPGTALSNIAQGKAAVWAGDTDGNAEEGDLETGLTDALANMMHWAKSAGVDFAMALGSAQFHFLAETDGTGPYTDQPAGGWQIRADIGDGSQTYGITRQAAEKMVKSGVLSLDSRSVDGWSTYVLTGDLTEDERAAAIQNACGDTTEG